ncbi:MAG: ABC transporter ATP-binding protein [Alphaproteobacteria bacterium]
MELIAGPNFSGRSAALMARLRERAPAFFIGPHAEAALSGLSSTVADEIEIYRAPTAAREIFAPLDFAGYADRKPPTLSGGEQVLLALHCFSLSPYTAIGIDTALEQLDPGNRDRAIAYLTQGAARDFMAIVADNRVDRVAGMTVRDVTDAGAEFACDLGAAARLPVRDPMTITVRDLSFRYPGGRDIFRDASVMLEPGHAYRLTGANGAGKTTFLKLLAGVLAPDAGQIELDGKPYAPWRTGNRAFAFATQNPDHQWCGATLGEDIARRRGVLARRGLNVPTDEALGALATCLGVRSLDQHLYELPLVARKRLSWLWPFSGVMPWAMLDEPTLGQDRATRAALADAIARLTHSGYGVVFITHDDDFAGRIAHRALTIADGTIA